LVHLHLLHFLPSVDVNPRRSRNKMDHRRFLRKCPKTSKFRGRIIRSVVPSVLRLSLRLSCDLALSFSLRDTCVVEIWTRAASILGVESETGTRVAGSAATALRIAKRTNASRLGSSGLVPCAGERSSSRDAERSYLG